MFESIVGQVSAGLEVWVDRVVAQQRLFSHPVDGIDAEAINAEIKPEAHRRLHSFANGWITPVKVGLLDVKAMQIKLLPGVTPFPGRTASQRIAPVVGRIQAVGCRLSSYG